MSRFLKIFVVLAVVTFGSLGLSYALAHQNPHKEAGFYPLNALLYFEDSLDLKKEVMETREFDSKGLKLMEVATTASDIRLTPSADGRIRLVYRGWVSAPEGAALEIEEKDGVLVITTREKAEGERRLNIQFRTKGRRSPELWLEIPQGIDARMDVRSVSGDVEAQGLVAERLNLATTSGDVLLTASRLAELRVETVSGDTELRATVPSATLETTSGDLDVVMGALVQSFEAKTVSGDVEINFEAGQSGQVDLQSVSGDLESRWPLERDDSPGRKTARGKLGDSKGGWIRIHTVSGDVAVN